MKKFIRLLLTLAAILTLGTATFSMGAEPYVSNASTASMSSGDAAAAYWTPERQQNAKPYPMPTLPGSPQSSPTTLQQATPAEPGVVPGRAPRGSALLSGDESAIHALAGGLQDAAPPQSDGTTPVLAAGYDYPPPHTTYFVYDKLYGSSRALYPFGTIGKVFFQASGVNYVCSGSSIGGRAVLTAGHCVAEGGGAFHTLWAFIPSYKNSRATSANTWVATELWTFSDWVAISEYGKDVGFAITANKGRSTLSAKVGSLGFAYNFSSPQHWTMFGYPAASPFDGKWLVQTDASFSRADANSTPNTFGMGTTQTGGCSGGPRILYYAPGMVGGHNYANGINSYYYVGSPNEIFSPYFDDAVYNFYTLMLSK
jgi:hypothetical protein